jgi:hypothetical protein
MAQTKNHQNQNGFAVLEVLLLLVLACTIAFTGWYVLKSKSDTKKSESAQAASPSPASSQTTTTPTEPITQTYKPTKSSRYTFDALGVSMDIPDGWNVAKDIKTKNGVNSYTWEITKAGADGGISVASAAAFYADGAYAEGEECTTGNPVKVYDIAPTSNPALTYVNWSQVIAGDTYRRSEIALTDTAMFSKTSDYSADKRLTLKGLKPGNYFYCQEVGPLVPGLMLNKEKSDAYHRTDNIDAYAAPKSGDSPKALPVTAKSYQEIRYMMLSIK